METDIFARWTRRIHERLSRRDLADLGAGAALAAVFGVATTAEAKKRKKKKKQGDRCAVVGQQCESDGSCCDQSGKVICEEVWDDRFEKESCPSGNFCCGVWGAPCTNHCDCCGYIQCLQTSTGPNCGGVIV